MTTATESAAMETAAQHYATKLVVSQSVKDVFDAINNVPAWWSEQFEGQTTHLNDVFTVRFGSEVYITMQVAELVANERIAWLVTDCNKPWLKDKKEWNGTKITWDIATHDGKTEIRFAHLGLVPQIECYGACSNAWGEYLQQSLLPLITSGKGKPTAK